MIDLSPLVTYFSGIGVTTIVVALIENKFHVVNRLRKRYAIIMNKNTEAKLSLEYISEKDFKEIKESFKAIFRGDDKFRVITENTNKLEIVYNIFSIKLLKTQDENISIVTDRIGCGIRGLKNKMSLILGKLKKLEKDKILNSFVSGDLSFSLPYKWDNMNIWTPKGLNLKKYNVSFTDDNYNSEINISLNKVNAKIDTKEAISEIIDKFI